MTARRYDVLTSETNIAGRLPEAGNLKLIITRPQTEKTYAGIERENTKAGRKLLKLERNTSKVLLKCD